MTNYILIPRVVAALQPGAEISERLRRILVKFQLILTAGGAKIDLDRNHDRGAGLA